MIAVYMVFESVHKLPQLSGWQYPLESGEFPDNADLVATVPRLFIAILRLIKTALY